MAHIDTKIATNIKIIRPIARNTRCIIKFPTIGHSLCGSTKKGSCKHHSQQLPFVLCKINNLCSVLLTEMHLLVDYYNLSKCDS